MADYKKDPEFIAWVERTKRDLVPMLEQSSVTVSIVPEGETDVKYAVELGLSIMMDKPIILVVSPGTKVPAKLALVADSIVEADWKNVEKTREAIGAAIGGLTNGA
jgi:hypothetical protein